MNIIEALRLAKTGKKVRPVSWATTRPGVWVGARDRDGKTFFAEVGPTLLRELRLQFEGELLGEWEVVA